MKIIPETERNQTMEQFGIVISEHCYLRREPGEREDCNESGIEDEIFSGWAVRVFPETAAHGWVKIETHYGYQGYVKMSELRLTSQEELRKRQDKKQFFRIGIGAADLLCEPKVQGLPVEFLLKNAFVELLEWEAADGWSRIRTAAGHEGYIHTVYLKERMDDDEYLLEACWGQEECGKTKKQGYFRERFCCTVIEDEESFRECLVRSAKAYLGTQYRWGGKSSQGLDCSGLVFMSYMENGVLIYRDANILPDYPVNEISRDALKKGDLIFFPGHVAMYLGDDRFIHSTAYAATPCVTINSLNPADEDYREDLAHKITGCGSVFDGWEKTNRLACDAERENSSTEDTKNEGHDLKVPQAYWSRLTERLSELPGNISFVYKNLATEEQFSYRAGEPHLAASVIKLFLMGAVFQSIEEGNIHAEDKIRVRRNDCVPSCGVLTYLGDEREVSVRDLVELMVIVSDNTAANLLFDLVGSDYLRYFIRDVLGMEQTVFLRKMFDSERAAMGIENYVTAADAAILLEKIYRGELVSRAASGEMYRILTHQRLNGKIPFRLHTLQPAPVIAHKTGEDTGVTHDVGIIEGKEPLLVCFLGSRTEVPEYERLIADVSLELYENCSQDVLV